MGVCNSYNNKENYILATFYINDKNVNNDIRIINSSDQYKENNVYKIEFNDLKKYESNEAKIKDCEIYINNRLIPFNYFHKFNEIGEYIIKYKFNQILTNTSFMFAGCEYLTEIKLSNFISKYVTDTSYMFFYCKSLAHLNFTNFDSSNVIYMNNMLDSCFSIVNLNLSHLNTQNVVDMSHMFERCLLLSNLDLTNFNTKNVNKMNSMFCKSGIVNLNLSNFVTNRVIDMKNMFNGCFYLTNLNIENFCIDEIIFLDDMFKGCSKLYLGNLNIGDINNGNKLKIVKELKNNLIQTLLEDENSKSGLYRYSENNRILVKEYEKFLFDLLKDRDSYSISLLGYEFEKKFHKLEKFINKLLNK